MRRSPLQVSLATMLALVACVAVNFWLFRLGVLYGLVGLNVTKHVAVATLCQILGVNRRVEPGPTTEQPAMVNATP